MAVRSGVNRLRFTDHAIDRMVERTISMNEVEAILRYGVPSPGKDGKILYSIDLSRIVWSPGERSLPLKLFGVVVVMTPNGACITVYRKGEDCAS